MAGNCIIKILLQSLLPVNLNENVLVLQFRKGLETRWFATGLNGLPVNILDLTDKKLQVTGI